MDLSALQARYGGAELSSLLGGSPARRAVPAGPSFADLLMEGFRARASRLGIELPAPAADAAAARSAGAPDAWALAERRSIAAGNGPGDAMLKVLGDAAAARYDRRSRESGAFDFLTSLTVPSIGAARGRA